MATDEDVATGLISWVNSLKVTEPFYTVDELATGEVIWKLLQLVDHISFPGSLPEDPSHFSSAAPQSWIPKWTNLKHVYDALSIFLIENLEQQLPIFCDSNGQRANPDLKAIAQHHSLRDAVILLKLCVVAAANCEERIRFLQPMQELAEHVQRVLMETLQEAQMGALANEEDQQGQQVDHEAYEEEDETVDEEDYFPKAHSKQNATHSRTKSVVPSSELEHEEKLSKVIADSARIAQEKRELQRYLDDSNARFSTLQERYDRSQDDLSEANGRLTAILSGRGVTTEKSFDAQKEAVIATLEARVAEYESDIEGLRKGNEVLRIKSEKTQKLQDDYDEIKIERDNLARKANAADKYRLKLESSQDMEKDNVILKQKIADLQAQVRQGDSRTASSGDLQREIDEYRRLLPAIEQERHEVNEMKKRLEFDYHMLQARYTEREEENRRARQEIEDLQERLRDYNDGDEPTSRRTTEGSPAGTESMEDESEVGTKVLEAEEAEFAAAEARLTAALLKPNETTTTNSESGENEDGITEDELKAIMLAMRAQMHAGTAQERESGMRMQKKMVIMLEKMRSKNAELVDHIKKQSELISELQSRPLETSEEKAQAEPKSESELEIQIEEQEVMIENLKREIRLISSAWFEQNQRLATLGSGSGGGAVALMRLKGGNGLEEPKSFLGRQRRMVDRVVLGTGVKVTRG